MRLQKYYAISTPGFFDVDLDRVDLHLKWAAEENSITVDEVISRLEAGNQVKFDTDRHSKLRCGDVHEQRVEARKAKQKPVKMVECDCGHTINSVQVMTSAFGSSCLDCYDRMSGEAE